MSKPIEETNTEAICELIETEQPFGTFLSGKYKTSFAYTLLKDKMPIILNNIIVTLNDNQKEITATYNMQAEDEIKQIVAGIDKLKMELIKNKPLYPLIPIKDKKDDDSEKWNNKIESLTKKQDQVLTWYNSIMFIAESYMYRRIAQEFFLTNYLKTYDPFSLNKYKVYYESLSNITLLSEHVIKLINTKNAATEIDKNLTALLELSLWSNRNDFCRSDLYLSDKSFLIDKNPLHLLESLDKNILVNNSKDIWNLLSQNVQNDNNRIIDIILDNASYELFSDLCLAIFLIESKLTNKIRFYVKCIPWFISDTTKNDFYWLLDTMAKSDNNNIQLFSQQCNKYLKNGSWIIEEESYWTEPFNYSEMKSVNPLLYNKLSEAILVIIKGDLNYSKLMSDFYWEYTTEFSKAHEFKPTNIVCLRTIKSDICVGLTDQKVEELKKQNPKWMYTGDFGVIQAFIKDY